MKKTRRILTVLFIVLIISMITIFAISSSAVSDDPADNYQVQVAPNEDSSINMWFDYSFRKTFTSDKTSTGMNTFSIYMAKNEIEDAQFVLYSDTDHLKMSATISEFSDGKGHTVPAAIYYEMYLTTENLNSTNIWGSTAETTFIREGETPDPIAPLANVGTFKLNGGKSQAFLIRATTTDESVSGWYSAKLDVKDSAGNIVKTATVYLYVWNFTLSEETAFETAIYISPTTDYGGTYEQFYNYLLENRMCGMDLPYSIISSHAMDYLTNDRVVSVRISENEHTYVYRGYNAHYQTVYNTLSKTDYWDEIEGKLYAYTSDEPLPKIIVGDARETVDTAHYYSTEAKVGWGSTIRTLVTETENHAYPYDHYEKPLTEYSQAELMDSIQALIEYDDSFIWCPTWRDFTPDSIVQSLGTLKMNYSDHIRGGSIYPYSGAWGVSGVCGGWSCWSYFDWEQFYGSIPVDRYKSDMTYKNSLGKDTLERELWAYCAGHLSSYSYCNHLVENTGLQTKMLFWQFYQEDVTGYLYYASNAWESSSPIDSTVTGAKSTCTWNVHRGTSSDGYYVYGDGILFYGMSMGKVKGCSLIGTLRVEIMRDGIEEYQMMAQLEELKGEDAAKSYVNSVSNNVVDYISTPKYDRSNWSSSMDEYDVMEYSRRALGNALEAATEETKCEHNWNSGEVTTAATCTHTGVKTYTCKLCGATEKEVIPSLHTNGATWTKISGVAATCTTNGSEVYKCDICGFEKTVKTTAFHNNTDYWTYSYKSDTIHNIVCIKCDTILDVEGHKLFYTSEKATCQSNGYSANECKKCHYKTEETILPQIDHNYVDGICTMCGEAEFTITYGDIDGNGKVNSADIQTLTKYLTGTGFIAEQNVMAADVSGDGKVNSTDTNLMIKFIAGILSSFPAEN